MSLICEIDRKRDKLSAGDEPKKFTDFWLESATTRYGDPRLTIRFDSEPLDEVVALAQQGWEPYQIYNVIYDSDTTTSVVITDDDRALAEKIRRHFQNKYLMRQLQQKEISTFQKNVLRLLESSKELNGSDIGPLVKLHSFYLEDKQSEKILANSCSIPTPGESFDLNNTELEFAGKVARKAKNEDVVRYFWRNKDGYLFKIDANANTHEGQAWKVVASVGKINVLGKIFTVHLHGYDFVVGELARSKFEILC